MTLLEFNKIKIREPEFDIYEYDDEICLSIQKYGSSMATIRNRYFSDIRGTPAMLDILCIKYIQGTSKQSYKLDILTTKEAIISKIEDYVIMKTIQCFLDNKFKDSQKKSRNLLYDLEWSKTYKNIVQQSKNNKTIHTLPILEGMLLENKFYMCEVQINSVEDILMNIFKNKLKPPYLIKEKVIIKKEKPIQSKSVLSKVENELSKCMRDIQSKFSLKFNETLSTEIKNIILRLGTEVEEEVVTEYDITSIIQDIKSKL